MISDDDRPEAGSLAPSSQSHEPEVFRAVVEESFQGVGILQDLRIAFANPAVSRITGYSPEELLALSPEEIRAALHPDDRDRVWDTLLENAQGAAAAPDLGELRFFPKRGEMRWLDAHVRRIPFCGKSALLVTCLDITDRKRAEEELRQSEARLWRLFLASPNTTLITSLEDGRILDINESFERATGYRREEVVGRSAATLDFFSDRSFIGRALWALRERGALHSVEMPFRARAG